MKIKITISRFINMCKNLIPLNDKDYLPVEDVAVMHEISVETLRSYENKKYCYGNEFRFKRINGKLFVHKNYKALLKEELETLYYKALVVARDQAKLSRAIAEMCGVKQSAIEKYFYRFNFKQIKKAQEVIEAMKKYISSNSLFAVEELAL